MRDPWARKITHGHKDIELRSEPCHILNERIGIIESGTGTIVGTTVIVDCFWMSAQQLTSPTMRKRHRLYDHTKHNTIISRITTEGGTWAWVCTDSRHYTVPISYTHPIGAVIDKWVNITRIQLRDNTKTDVIRSRIL